MISSKPFMLSLPIIFFISTAAISILVNVNSSNFVSIWNTFSFWLKPPYLYVTINAIIIIIALSSRFGHNRSQHHEFESRGIRQLASVRTTPSSQMISAALPVPEITINSIEVPPVVVYETERSEIEDVVDVKPVVVDDGGAEVVEYESDENRALEDDDLMISRSVGDLSVKINSAGASSEILSPVTERPLLSSRFGPRKAIKASTQGGRALKVTRPKTQETLETTWKLITDRSHVPLTRHLKKSDPLDHHGHQSFVNKSSTSRVAESTWNWLPSPKKIKKDLSLSQDELYRRAEAFIKKFNEEMRIQRQQSLNQYMEMIHRGAS